MMKDFPKWGRPKTTLFKLFSSELERIWAGPVVGPQLVDLFFAYRLFLQRRPEFDDAASYRTRLGDMDFRGMVASFLDSEEFAKTSCRIPPDITVMAESEGRRFWFSLRDQAVGLDIARGRYEPSLTAAVEAAMLPGMNAIDVGANIGYYSVLMAQRSESGVVWALEPFPPVYRLLLRNISENGLQARVHPLQYAAWDSAGQGDLWYVNLETNKNFGSMFVSDEQSQPSHLSKLRIDRCKIDDLVPLDVPVHIIKIDAEGAEMHVLQGMHHIIKVHRPLIFIELNEYCLRRNGSTAEQLVGWLTAEGYTLYDVETSAAVMPGQERKPDFLANVQATARVGQGRAFAAT